MLGKIISLFKKSKTLEKYYLDLKFFRELPIPEITPVEMRKSRFDFQRINLLVPSINTAHVFGGVATALTFFDKMIEEAGDEIHFRIILTDSTPDEETLAKFPDYVFVASQEDLDDRFQILPFSDRHQKTLPVTRNDKFIATAWWTAHAAQSVIKRQAEMYDQSCHPMVYFIQDFEPCFYNWSSRYILADATYRSDIQVLAVFNTSMLRDYFRSNGYSFFREYSFEPTMHEKLKMYLENGQELREKKKQILIYGRPSVPRNAFNLIVESLRKWILLQPDAKEWTVFSAGEAHPDVALGKGVFLKSVGKLDLGEYAQLLAESAVGVSLMVSPHPSYPPFEMACFGVRTITNSFANKELSGCHENIVSINNLTPEYLAAAICDQCDKFQESDNDPVNSVFKQCYLDSYDQFGFVSNIVKEF